MTLSISSWLFFSWGEITITFFSNRAFLELYKLLFSEPAIGWDKTKLPKMSLNSSDRVLKISVFVLKLSVNIIFCVCKCFLTELKACLKDKTGTQNTTKRFLVSLRSVVLWLLMRPFLFASSRISRYSVSSLFLGKWFRKFVLVACFFHLLSSKPQLL